MAGLAAVFTFPLRHGDAQLGALDLYRDTPGTLSHKAMTDAQTLADVAAAYLLNAQGQSRTCWRSRSGRLTASLHDALTGLPNRTLILERLEHAALRGQRSGKTAAVLFIDLDRFKVVNDTYGHRVGDETLIAVSKRWSGCCDQATPRPASAVTSSSSSWKTSKPRRRPPRSQPA